MRYSEFLASKRVVVPEVGFEPTTLPSFLYPFQRELVATSLRRGRSAMFEECGLGKTGQQLAWAWACACAEKTGKPSLVLAPLAVAKQGGLKPAPPGDGFVLVDVYTGSA